MEVNANVASQGRFSERLMAEVMHAALPPGFRKRWWRKLEAEQPEVAERLVRMFPDRYPVMEGDDERGKA